MLVVDLSTPVPDADVLAAARRNLAELPCPALGIGAPRDEAARAFAERLDVVREHGDLDTVLENVDACPIAAMALAQLLRGGHARPVHEGLLAESLVYSTLQSGPEFARWCAGRAKKPTGAGLRPAVSTARSGARLDIELDRPEKHNAFSADMRDGLSEALQIAVGDPSIEEIRLCGRGPSFCSGGDLDEFASFPDPATAHAVRGTRNPARLLHAVGERVTVEVHGACVGAGVELPAFASRVVAVGDAFFQLPELRMGLVPGAGGTVSLPRRIGRQRTAWLALSCERIPLETALEWGIVDERV